MLTLGMFEWSPARATEMCIRVGNDRKFAQFQWSPASASVSGINKN